VRRSLARGLRPLLLALAFAVASPDTGAGEALFVVEDEDGQLVFTNTADTAGARLVPGFAAETAPRITYEAVRSVRLPETIYDDFIDRVGDEYGVSPRLIKAVAVVESGLDPHAVSHKGAQGLMQLMPATARRYGVRDAFDPLENLRAGTAHLRDLLLEFDGNLTLALAAYNAGAGAVRRAGGVPAYRETRNYVTRVRSRLGEDEDLDEALPAAAEVPAVEEAPARPVRMVKQADGSILLVN
jgi:hypothetical protein